MNTRHSPRASAERARKRIREFVIEFTGNDPCETRQTTTTASTSTTTTTPTTSFASNTLEELPLPPDILSLGNPPSLGEEVFTSPVTTPLQEKCPAHHIQAIVGTRLYKYRLARVLKKNFGVTMVTSIYEGSLFFKVTIHKDQFKSLRKAPFLFGVHICPDHYLPNLDETKKERTRFWREMLNM
jgi:hypothetical protein